MSMNENLLDIGGSVFTIDLDSFTSLLTTTQIDNDGVEVKGIEVETKTDYDAEGKPLNTTVIHREYEKGSEIDGPKYDVIRMCLEILMTYHEEVDDTLGFENAMAKTTISFKMAFNTLLTYGILKEIE